MSDRAKHIAACVAFIVVALAPRAGAETVYAASVRTAATAPNAAGTLYTIDPATAAAKVVAPIRLDGVHPIGAIGLAVQPRTGVFYAITGQYSWAAPRSLVTIDPESGHAKLVGPLGVFGTDIGFDPEGTLYVWMAELNQVGTVDLTTGKATMRGAPSTHPADRSGGLAIVSSELGYVAATGATGTLDTLDLRTGTRTPGPTLTGAPFPHAITNLAFAPSGRLYAVNSSSGAPAETMLVTIDLASGAILPIGPLPADIEGLIFAERERPFFATLHRGLLSSALAALVIAAVLAAMGLMAKGPQ